MLTKPLYYIESMFYSLDVYIFYLYNDIHLTNKLVIVTKKNNVANEQHTLFLKTY